MKVNRLYNYIIIYLSVRFVCVVCVNKFVRERLFVCVEIKSCVSLFTYSQHT